MELLERILNCSSDDMADLIITEEIKRANDSSTKVETLGFLDILGLSRKMCKFLNSY